MYGLKQNLLQMILYDLNTKYLNFNEIESPLKKKLH